MTVALRRSWAKDLDVPTLYELLKLRVEVFVVEQATPYPELDGRDLLAETRHFWLESPDGEVISTLRLMEEHPGGEKAFRIGRVCTRLRAPASKAPSIDHNVGSGTPVHSSRVSNCLPLKAGGRRDVAGALLGVTCRCQTPFSLAVKERGRAG